MEASSRAGAARAFWDGMERVAAAPAILLGSVALVVLYGAPEDARHLAGALLLSTFLLGGILDRYARQRPTRARGFFAACGAHFGAMLRLAGIVLLVFTLFHVVIGRDFPNDYVHEAAFLAALLIVLLMSLAAVRIAVEDRRSALGALLAGGRFAARNPAALVLFALLITAALSIMLASERLLPPADASITSWISAHAVIAIETALALVWLATAVALFQSRLAHAGYTAAPPQVWPDSPAAEAIVNRPPTLAP